MLSTDFEECRRGRDSDILSRYEQMVTLSGSLTHFERS